MIVERFTAQLLCGPPAHTAVEVVERLLAVQGQDPRGCRLAIRARTAGLGVADVDRALTVDRSLVITWLNRGTLHLVRSEDYWLLHQLTTPRLFAGNARRLAQEGVSPAAADRGVAVAEHALAADGPLTGAQLRDRIAAAGVPVQGQALVHILMLASLRGRTVRGPMIGTEQAYVLVPDWLGAPPSPPDHDTALRELARRYLAGHAPAADRDLSRWSGLPLGESRRALAALGSAIDEWGDGLVDLVERRRIEGPPPPRLLGAYDPLLLGWASRAWVLGSAARAITVNGLFRPFAVVRGHAVATWSLRGGRVVLAPFGALPAADASALDADAADVERFLGRTRSRPQPGE